MKTIKRLLFILGLTALSVVGYSQSKMPKGAIIGSPYANMLPIDSVKAVGNYMALYSGDSIYFAKIDTTTLRLATGATVNEIETTATDSDTKIPTSGALVDYTAANYLPLEDTTTLYEGYGIDLDWTLDLDSVAIEVDTAQIATLSALNDSIANNTLTGPETDISTIAYVLVDSLSTYQFGFGGGLAADTARADTLADGTGMHYGTYPIMIDTLVLYGFQTYIPVGDTLNAIVFYNDSSYVTGPGSVSIDTLNITGGDNFYPATAFNNTKVPHGNKLCVIFGSSTNTKNPTEAYILAVAYIKRD